MSEVKQSMLIEAFQALVRCYRTLEQLSFELEYMKHIYLAVMTDYSIYTIPFASEMVMSLYGEFFNQHILFQEQQEYLCSLQPFTVETPVFSPIHSLEKESI